MISVGSMNVDADPYNRDGDLIGVSNEREADNRDIEGFRKPPDRLNGDCQESM